MSAKVIIIGCFDCRDTGVAKDRTACKKCCECKPDSDGHYTCENCGKELDAGDYARDSED